MIVKHYTEKELSERHRRIARLSKKNGTPAEQAHAKQKDLWTKRVYEWCADTDNWPTDEVRDKAAERIASGDVCITRYGPRVECRHDLDDNRADAKAYWPGARKGCRCRAYTTHGECSHRVAAAVFAWFA